MILLYYYYFASILFLLTNPSFSTQFNPSSITMPTKRNFSSFSLSSTHNSSPQQQQEESIMGISVTSNSFPNNKKLRRLPHVFSKSLELPFDLDADVRVEEHHDCFKFSVKVDHGEIIDGFTAHVVEVHPGITKVVIRRRENLAQLIVDDLRFHVWQVRLPPCARAELATVDYDCGELVVKVPKNGCGENNSRGGHCMDGFRGNMGTLVLVQ
ncbi:uncharacterized protein LOC104898930 [Beta vulgaris subsp. vulgaris]|uniref:uncharacterized protein LOC104898930 n=1 Tax=Beta vulgaris subsp. vulgaris TaxID=3555 RepID=UPI002036D108|nr:uncharacterized protein LOC104898930 [Beta vulgaris subsp. vulgaris]